MVYGVMGTQGGRVGEREQRMLDKSILGIGWVELPDLSKIQDRKSLEALYRQIYPDASDNRVSNHVGQLYSFLKTAKVGDLVAVPLKTRAAIAIGELAGDYQFRQDLGQDMQHTRPIRWLKTDIPRNKFDQDLLYTFGAFMTFCRAERNNAEDRVKRILTGAPTPQPQSPISPHEIPSPEQVEDIDQYSRDHIMRFIGQEFRGHDLARLVEAILQAQGMITKRSDPGPDGGVDILAGSGPMGFDSPRICVQVKSSDTPVDVNVYRSLKGTMYSFSADQGMLVAWGGFRDGVVREAQASFFRVRLWDAGALLEAILTNYEQLPEEIQAELPLKRVWALTLPDTED